MKTTNIMTTVAALVFALAPAAQAAPYEWIGGDSGEWTDPNNWDLAGYPNGVGVTANFGVKAQVNVSSPVTVGEITDTGAGQDTFLHTLTATGSGSITFDNGGSGALFRVAQTFTRDPGNTTYSVPMVLDDDLEIQDSTQMNRNFDGQISGTGELTWTTISNGATITIGGSSPNTYSGGTIISDVDPSWASDNPLVLDKDGALGTGNVTMTADSADATEVRITDAGATDDRIADSASLYMEQDATGGYSVLTLDANVDETIGGLYLNGAPQPDGTYNVGTHPNWFQGQGNLIVQAPTSDEDIPEPATMCALGLAVAGLGGYVRKRRKA